MLLGWAFSQSLHAERLEFYPWYGQVTEVTPAGIQDKPSLKVCIKFESSPRVKIDESCETILAIATQLEFQKSELPPPDDIYPQYAQCKGMHAISLLSEDFSFFNSLLQQGWEDQNGNIGNSDLNQAVHCQYLTIKPPADGKYIIRLLINPFPLGFIELSSSLFDLRYSKWNFTSAVKTSETEFHVDVPIFGIGRINDLDLAAAFVLTQSAVSKDAITAEADCEVREFDLSKEFSCEATWMSLEVKASDILIKHKLADGASGSLPSPRPLTLPATL